MNFPPSVRSVDLPALADALGERHDATIVGSGAIELVAPRLRAGVEGKLAHLIAHGASVDAMLEALIDYEGGAEVYADEQQLEALLVSSERRRR